jgi:hypothetical protein
MTADAGTRAWARMQAGALMVVAQLGSSTVLEDGVVGELLAAVVKGSHAPLRAQALQLCLLLARAQQLRSLPPAAFSHLVKVRLTPHVVAAMQKLRIVTLRFRTGRQKMAQRWTNHTLSRRSCTCEYGVPSCRRKSAGVAKRPRERSPTRNPARYDSQLCHRRASPM